MAKRKAKTPAQSVADESLTELVGWVNEADDATQESRELSEKCRDYYDSKQLDAKEIATLKRRGQAPVVINRVKPKVDTLRGLEKSAKTTAKAFPRTPKHEDAAEAASEGIRFVLQDNHFDQIRSQTWENILIEGTGGGDVIVKPAKDGYRVTISPIQWDRIIYDPHSRRKDFSDARYLGQVIWTDYDEALEDNPQAADILESLITGSQTYDDKPRWMDAKRKRVKIVELYYKKDGDIWYARFTRGGYLEGPKISPYKNEEGETEWAYEFISAHIDREGGRYGAIKQFLDVQDEINKRRSKALHLMSVRQTYGTKGTVEDINKFRQELAKPDGHAEYGYGQFGKDFGILPTGDMAQAQFNLLTEAKNEIDLIGANAALQGKDKTVQSGIALQRREVAGQTEIGPLFDTLRYWETRVYRKVWNRIRQYWKSEKWIRVTDDENNLRWVGLNKPVTRGEMLLKQQMAAMQQQGLPPEQMQQAMAGLQARIQADPMMKEVVKTENEVAELDVDIILSEVPDVLTAQIEDFQVLGEMVKSGFQMPPMAVIEASPLSNKDKILKMMKESPQLPPAHMKQMQAMQEEMKRLAGENQQLKTDTQSTQAKIEARKLEQDAELALKRDMQTEELRLLEEKTDKEIDLKRHIANADYEIEQRKLEQARECEDNKLNMTQDHETKKLDFERQKHNDEQSMMAEETAMPKAVETMAKITEVFTNIDAILQKQTAIQEKTLEVQDEILKHQKAPKRIGISGVQKGADGRITGATVSTTVQ